MPAMQPGLHVSPLHDREADCPAAAAGGISLWGNRCEAAIDRGILFRGVLGFEDFL